MDRALTINLLETSSIVLEQFFLFLIFKSLNESMSHVYILVLFFGLIDFNFFQSFNDLEIQSKPAYRAR